MSRPISFLSDFGLRDEFVGVVHGVIARIAPDVRVIDLTHGIPRGDIRAGALALVRAIQYLPPGVALAIVDPGVGSARKAVAVETRWGHFVGPDNGILSPAVAMVGGARRAVSIENDELVIPGRGRTFDGRDRFGPAAALLASGEAPLDELGPEIEVELLTPMMLPLPEIAEGFVQGEIWWIDGFGNAQTNVGPDDLDSLGLAEGDEVDVQLAGAVHTLPWVRSYADVVPGGAMLLVDSSGLIALSVREGSAADQLGVVSHTAVTFRRP
jgi:S-adenosylmethionine hydrolase